MNNIEFFTEDNKYKIILTKKKKQFSYTELGQYICTITFKDTLNNTVLQIDSTEKEYFRAIQSLQYFQSYYGNIESDIIYFNSNGINTSFFWYISITGPDYPTEYDKLSIGIYESYFNNNILRLYLEFTLDYMEDFVYNLFLLIEDLPYLDKLSMNLAQEIYGGIL